jgi:curved DNA-binding protein CbpA/Tfp pilus assembly protein PilF
MAMKTLYDVFGVRPDADAETIKQAFRTAVKAHHPDHQGGDPAANRRVKAIIAASKILRDPERRAAYDRHLAFQRERARSKRRRAVIRFAFGVVVLSAVMVGAGKLWLGLIAVPPGKVAGSMQRRDDVATVARPERDPPQARGIGNDAQPPAAQGSSREGSSGEGKDASSEDKGSSSEGRPVSHSFAREGRGGAADAEAAIESATREESIAAVALPATASSYRESAIEWSRKGDLDRAIADLERAIELAPGDAKAYHQRGNAWGLKGDVDRALADYDRALRFAPNDSAVFHDRGLMWQRNMELDKALVDLDRAVRMSFTDPQVYSDRGAVWFEKGRYDRALADLDQAIKINPRLATAYVRRAGVFERKGDQERARADRDQATLLDHGTPVFQSDVGSSSAGAH